MIFQRSIDSADTGTTSTAPAATTSTSATSTSSSSPASTGGLASGAVQAAIATQGASTTDIPILTRYAGIPIAGPAYQIPEGAVVEVLPYYGNTVTAFLSTAGLSGAQNGPRMPFPITSANPRVLNIRNLCDLSVYSPNVGEGVQVTIRNAR